MMSLAVKKHIHQAASLALTLVMVAVYLFIQFYSLWWRFKLEKEM